MNLRRLPTQDRGKVPQSVIDGLKVVHDGASAAILRLTELTPIVRRLASQPAPQSMQQIEDALEWGGAHALNVTGLMGILAQPQAAGIPLLEDFPPTSAADNGRLVNVGGVLYYYDSANFEPGEWVPLTANAAVIINTHAVRLADHPAATQPVGELYWESDRTALYAVTNPGGGNVWSLLMSRPMQATLANLPADLGADDEGFLFTSTDFGHVWRWDGANWHYAPWDDGRGYIVFRFYDDGAVVPGYALCDGSNQTFSKDDGTTEVLATPDFVSTPTFARGAAALGGSGQVTTGAGPSNYIDTIPYIRL